MTQNVTITGATRTATAGTSAGAETVTNAFQSQMIDDMGGVFFNDKEFSIPVSIYHSILSAWHNYRGLFEDPSTTSRVDEAAVLDWSPQVMVAESQLKARIAKRDKVIVNSVEYQIESVDYDGFGVVTAVLRRT